MRRRTIPLEFCFCLIMRFCSVCLFLLCLPLFGLGQEASVIKLKQLETLLATKSEKIQVINFWATWCAPCVKELPMFETLHAAYPEDLKVTLINLDYADQIKKVNSFLARKKMKAEVLLLDEIDYNSWIDTVDERWHGALPATLVFNPVTGRRKFIERELKEGELEQFVSEVK